MGAYPDAAQVLASAAQFLIEGDERDAASLLLSCESAEFRNELVVEYDGDMDAPTKAWRDLLYVRGPRQAFVVINDLKQPLGQAIQRAVQAVLHGQESFGHVVAQARLVELTPEWRAELAELARGKIVHNQGSTDDGGNVIPWKGLRYRSHAEVKVADALDQASAFFLPNCRGRLAGSDGRRVNREPDFLVCRNGHWGVLEVDGELYHQQAAKDHERDRLYDYHARPVREGIGNSGLLQIIIRRGGVAAEYECDEQDPYDAGQPGQHSPRWHVSHYVPLAARALAA